MRFLADMTVTDRPHVRRRVRRDAQKIDMRTRAWGGRLVPGSANVLLLRFQSSIAGGLRSGLACHRGDGEPNGRTICERRST